jgi:electron transfer flavoprotein alpha subunit
VSALLDCGLTADCSGLDVRDFTRRGETFHGILYQTRPALGGNIMATIVSIYGDPAGRPQMATVRPGALPAFESPADACETHVFRAPPPPPGAGDAISVERRPEGEKEIELEDYEVIVCAGMGVGDHEAVEAVVEPFRSAVERWLGVPVGLGCSRAMVDAGVLPHAHQIGQTGIVVKPKIYFGLGVSGAIQHKIGMEGSRIIVSVNRDPVAPIHGFADHAIIGEVRSVLPTLTDAMGQKTGTDAD